MQRRFRAAPGPAVARETLGIGSWSRRT